MWLYVYLINFAQEAVETATRDLMGIERDEKTQAVHGLPKPHK